MLTKPQLDLLKELLERREAGPKGSPEVTDYEKPSWQSLESHPMFWTLATLLMPDASVLLQPTERSGSGS